MENKQQRGGRVAGGARRHSTISYAPSADPTNDADKRLGT